MGKIKFTLDFDKLKKKKKEVISISLDKDVVDFLNKNFKDYNKSKVINGLIKQVLIKKPKQEAK